MRVRSVIYNAATKHNKLLIALINCKILLTLRVRFFTVIIAIVKSNTIIDSKTTQGLLAYISLKKLFIAINATIGTLYCFPRANYYYNIPKHVSI